MNAPSTIWERPHYAPGGGTPFLFYVVFGDVDLGAVLSRSEYRSNGVPEGLEVASYGPEHREVLEGFRRGYLWDEFVRSDPERAAEVARCERCVVLRGTPKNDATLDYLRDVVGLVTFFLAHGGVAVFDPLMFRWWNASAFRQGLFEPDGPVPRHHVVILVSQEEDDPSLKWFHTRGMRKFGRPDIGVHGVTEELESGVLDLCNRLIEHQAFGLVVNDGQAIRTASLPPGGVMRHAGDLDDPEFNNVHLEVLLPEAE